MYPTNMSINIESGGHPVLSNQHRMHFKRKIIGPNKLVHKLEWRFYARRRYSPSCGRKTLQRLGSKMRVGESRPHVSMSDSPDIGFSRGEAKALRVCLMFLLCHHPHSRSCRHSNGGEGCYKWLNYWMVLWIREKIRSNNEHVLISCCFIFSNLFFFFNNWSSTAVRPIIFCL